MKKHDVTSKGVSRQKNADIAADTMQLLKKHEIRFREESENSVLFTENDLCQPIAPDRAVFDTVIEVTSETTLAAMSRFGDSPFILNFASAKNPGGGFLKGSSAQEESLARSSSLFYHLNRFKKPFYEFNKAFPGVYSHRIIFSPAVTFLKNDRGKLLDKEVHCAVVTCPAVNAGVAKVSAEEVRALMEERMIRILRCCAERNAKVLILGAFGCGVFKNDPENIASIWHRLLFGEEFKGVFQHVVFACYGPKENFDAFKIKFQK